MPPITKNTGKAPPEQQDPEQDAEELAKAKAEEDAAPKEAADAKAAELAEAAKAKEAEEAARAQREQDAAAKAAIEANVRAAEAIKAKATGSGEAGAAAATGAAEFEFVSPRPFRLHEGTNNKGIEFQVVKGTNRLPASFRLHWYLRAQGCTLPDGSPLPTE